MMVTGLLFLVTCLPIVTIGASLCAFYYTAMDSLRKEDGYIFKRYFVSFGKNFKKATGIWLIMLALGIIFGVDIVFWLMNSGTSISVVMLIVSGLLTFAWLITVLYVFPLQTRFENTIRKTIQNAFLIALSHLPFTIAIILLFALLGFLCYVSWFVVCVMILFGNGVVGYLLVYNFERLFKKSGYIDEDDGKIKNDDYEFNVDVDFDEVYGREAEENGQEARAEADADVKED